VATRRLLASGALGPVCDRGIGVTAVSFLTVYRLAELLGSSRLAGAGRRPVSTPVIAAALRAALARDPGIFRNVASHSATETALIEAYRELRDLSDSALNSLARTSARASDVVRLHRAARVTLEPDWYDEEDLLDAAAAAVGFEGSAMESLGRLVAYLPERLSQHGARLIRAVAERSEVVVLAGTTGDARADAEVDRSIRLIGGTEAGRLADDFTLEEVVDTDRTRIITVSDCDDEVRAAVRAVVEAARAGTALDRISILHASPEPYARLCHEQLSAAGIAHNGAAVTPLTSRIAGRTLLQLLALPEGGFRRDDVFGWMAGARLHVRGRPVPVTAWERISREAGVVAGREDWDRRLATFADDCDVKAALARSDPDSASESADRHLANAEKARALREFALGVIDDLEQAAAPGRPWGQRVNWAHRRTKELIGDDGRRARWPMVEQKAADRVERALDRLGCLDAIEKSVELDVFTRTFELELEADLGRVGRMGEGVLVGPVSMGVGLDLDLVVVLGLAEGLFPVPTRDDSLLPDHEREKVGEELPLRSQRVERQHRQLLAALAGARRHVLCVPRGDLRRNIDRVPSRWVLQIAGAIAGKSWSSADLLRADAPWLEHVASFDAGLRRMPFPASEQEHRLRSLMVQGSTRLAPSAFAAVDDATLISGAAVVDYRRSERFTRFDGNLAGLSVPSPADQVTSATRLELWASCPFAYLLHNLLHVEEVENPEDQLQISPRDRGSLIHQVLEQFIDEVLDRQPNDIPGPSEPWSRADRARMLQIGETWCTWYEARGLTGRAIFWQRDKKHILDDLGRFLLADSIQRSATGTQPIAAELAFGLPGAQVGVVPLQLPDGRNVYFRGKADRVDRAADGTVHVLDYKTGASQDYQDLSKGNPDAEGRKLQLAVYGQAARQFVGDLAVPVLAEYWFVSAKGRFARVGYFVTPDVLERVGRTLAAMAAGIEAGVFPNHPTATSTTPWVECAYCDPDHLGVVELRRRFERKQADPAMAAFVGLARPLADAPLDAWLEDLPDA